jgi:hypothetical protein
MLRQKYATMNSKSIMQNDTVRGSPPLTGEDLRRMPELAGYSIDRRDAELWAQNEIKFLVYDDSSALESGYDSDDEQGILEFALRLSQMTINADDNDELADKSKEASSEPSKKKTSTCFCHEAPPFPKTFHPTKLKLFRPENLMSCDHYIAVSYCWPAEDHENGINAKPPSAQAYKVRDLNGVVRPARAPDWVLRRAIEVAASCGINMIWIDQECLPQPTADSTQSEKDEQQKGIQAMDIIYSRAAVTAGLLSDARLASQRHMDALTTIQSWEDSDVGRAGQLISKIQTEMDVDEQTMNLVMDVFESIVTDRWYTRAWITQEALSAGSSLVLVLAGGDIARQPEFSLRDAKSSKHVTWRSISSKIFVMPMDVLHTSLTLAEKLLPLSIEPRPNRPPANIRTIHRSIPIINRTREFNMRFKIRGGEESQLLMGAGDKAATSRCTIDAASALGLLSSRSCRNVEDRIAIVANMCNFHVRLDTYAMARRCKSLKLALLTLAIANGDYSLLVPEAFAVEHGKSLVVAYK